MRKTYLVIGIMAALITFFVQACIKRSKAAPYGTGNSHLTGFACMDCHYEGGANKTTFTVSGTVLDEARAGKQPEAVVKLYTEAYGQGKLVATVYTDTLGNFYTSEKIDFSKGLYATLLGTPGVKEDTKHMPLIIVSGNCNACHGPTTERLGID